MLLPKTGKVKARMPCHDASLLIDPYPWSASYEEVRLKK